MSEVEAIVKLKFVGANKEELYLNAIRVRDHIRSALMHSNSITMCMNEPSFGMI